MTEHDALGPKTKAALKLAADPAMTKLADDRDLYRLLTDLIDAQEGADPQDLVTYVLNLGEDQHFAGVVKTVGRLARAISQYGSPKSKVANTE
jgi:hypothetical protein